MAPNNLKATGILFEIDEDIQIKKPPIDNSVERKPLWIVIVIWIYLHAVAAYGVYLLFTAKFLTIVTLFVVYHLGMLGITAGVHRLWSHRSYKATWQLRLLLTILQTFTAQDPVIDWVRDHRLHHKFNETDADPYNNTRGFFYSHIGWTFYRKHPLVLEKGKEVDFSDLFADSILRFQKKYYYPLSITICFVLPTVIPMYLWGEAFVHAFAINVLRYILCLNSTMAVNSFAHRWGNKPYEKNFGPSENLSVTMLTLGEGWHNYHHTFPWDYRAAELGKFGSNFTCDFLHLMAKIGWAYDLKTVSAEMIKKRVLRTGDGSHELWGWGDKHQSQEERDEAIVKHPKVE